MLREECRSEVIVEGQRFEMCFGPNEELVEQALQRCDQSSAEELRTPVTDSFETAFDNCQDTLECDELGEGDEICVPIALEELAAGSVPQELIASCIASSDVDMCANTIASTPPTELETSALGRCLQQWSSCRDELAGSEPYWTKSHCTTLIALNSQAQSSAIACLQSGCADVAACLIEAGAFDP